MWIPSFCCGWQKNFVILDRISRQVVDVVVKVLITGAYDVQNRLKQEG